MLLLCDSWIMHLIQLIIPWLGGKSSIPVPNGRRWCIVSFFAFYDRIINSSELWATKVTRGCSCNAFIVSVAFVGGSSLGGRDRSFSVGAGLSVSSLISGDLDPSPGLKGCSPIDSMRILPNNVWPVKQREACGECYVRERMVTC